LAEPGGFAGPRGLSARGEGVGPVFLGTHTPRLDDKGRLILPAKFRDDLAGGVVITKGQAQPVTHKAARAYGRVFFASAHDELPDKQGRVTIPAHLREYAGLDRDVAVIGASNRVEIWDQQAWETYLATNEDAFAGIEEGVLPGGL